MTTENYSATDLHDAAIAYMDAEGKEVMEGQPVDLDTIGAHFVTVAWFHVDGRYLTTKIGMTTLSEFL